MQSDNRNITLLIGSGFTILAVVIFAGFNVKELTTTHCTSYSTIYKVANFSEVTTGVDMDGNLYSDTDYWYEPVSHIYYAKLHNLSVIDSNIEYKINDNRVAVLNNDFPYDRSAKGSRDFDNFSTKKETINKQFFNDGDHVTINSNHYLSCFNSIDESTKVKYWYNISYGVEK